jgi:hypothetical protein
VVIIVKLIKGIVMNLIREMEVTNSVNEVARRAAANGDIAFNELIEVHECNQEALKIAIRGVSSRVLVDLFTSYYPIQDFFETEASYEEI